jgi:UDP-glucose 4-epimerase
LLDAASGRRKDVTVFGTDYATQDGTCVRDYIHVSDLAEAHVKALRALFDGGRSSIYNLGNGRGFSVKEVIDAVERVTGLTVPIVFGDRRAGDPAALISDASKARDELEWRPRFAGMDQIVRTAWAWHQKAWPGR